MKNFGKESLENIASEALNLHRKIALDKKKFLDLKQQILEASEGRNTSYKIPLDKGTVRINKTKESISYNFDQEKFEGLDNQAKDKFLKEEVVIAKLSYSLNKNKIESIKSKNEFSDLNDLITENRKDAYFTISFWQNKNNSPMEETTNQNENENDFNKKESFIKRLKKKIF